MLVLGHRKGGKMARRRHTPEQVIIKLREAEVAIAEGGTEEILLDLSGSYTTLVTSNQVPRGQLLMSDAQIGQLRRHLQDIHDHFEDLYNPGPDEPFAMEIEFKITSDDVLSIKQARPWVFGVPNALGHGGETPEREAIWSATLTVGVGEDFAGYSSFAQGEENNTLGALSSDTITLDDASHTVKALGVLNGKLILSVLPKLSAGFVLVAGTSEFASTDASTLEGDSLIQFQWNYPGLDLSEGEEVAVRLAAPDDGTPATGLPVITGTARVGQTLTVDTSAIADEDGLDNVSYSYQWIANDGTNDADIGGQTGSTYTLTDEDVGKSIKVRVSFTDDADNEETLTSAATGVVAAKPNSPATGAPTIDGTAQVGETLTVLTNGITDEDGLDNVSYSYQWIANDGTNDAEIGGQTGSTYTLTDEDMGKSIKVRVSFTDDADHEETLTSAATGVVAAKPNSPATGAPTIDGTAQVGETLTVLTNGITDEDGLDNVSYSYQWIANDGTNDADIGGQTGSTYTLTDEDMGKSIKVRVSFTDDADHEETLTSAATGVVAAKPNSPATGAPTIDGTAQVGETLTVLTNGITDEDGLDNVSYSYQWIANDGTNDADIGGQTGSTYTLTDEDMGKSIKVRVSFTDDADNEETLTSAATGVVAAKPNSPATGAPTIDGTAQVGETLTVLTNGITDEDGLDNVSYSYQWIANDGTNDADIGGQTGSTYTLTDEDVGKSIKVRVSFTDDADHEETRTSEATDTVAATKPGVPGHMNVFPHDTRALDVYWEAPASDGGSDITGYKVQWKESADSWETPADFSEATASGTIHTITGLTDGVEYSVRVLATNGVGDSPPSVEQTGTPRGTKAPEMVRSRVDGATLKVLYDETLDEGSAPPTDSFDVRVACTCDDTTWLDEEAKRAVESVSVDGDMVVLTLVSAATSEDVVVVSYTPPSDAATARTRDLAGNAAAGFNSTEVFNDTDETAESEENGEPEDTTEGETPLNVSLEVTTESHNGTDAFTFEIRFSEEFPLSYKTLRDLAFTVSGGEVLKAQRLDKPSNIRWLITVEPDSNGDVTVVLPVTQNCTADGAICTGDGRKLSTRLELTVSGPGQ